MHIPDALKSEFHSQLNTASAVIHRHPQPTLKNELVQLSEYAQERDSRDSYGRGGIVSEFEEQICELFDKPSALFLPTGTLAQCVAMKCYSEASGKNGVGLHPTSHLRLHEHDAIQHLWGLSVHSMGEAQRALTAVDITQLNPEHMAAIIVETPMREIGGAMPSWDDLLTMRAWCSQHNVRMHLDGARIWQATEYYQRSLAQIAELFDSIYVSFYKDLGGIFGAALIGTDELMEPARVWSRRAGGNPITLYPEVLSARKGLESYLLKMPDFVEFTKTLTDLLSSAGFEIIPSQPKAAMFHIRLPYNATITAEKLVHYAQQQGIIVLPLPRAEHDEKAICEVSIGDRALEQAPEFWVKHLSACFS